MVTAGNDEIKLVLTVDRADIERQLSQGFDAAMGKAPTGGPAAGKSRQSLLSTEDHEALRGFREQRRQQREVAELKSFQGGGGGAVGGGRKAPKVNPGGAMIKVLKPLAALFGISLGIGLLVSNSKVLQTTASAFKSILGAFLDIFLIAFMPLISKVLKWLIGLLPAWQRWVAIYGPKMVDFIVKVFNYTKTIVGPALEGIWETIKKLYAFFNIGKNVVKKLVDPDLLPIGQDRSQTGVMADMIRSGPLGGVFDPKAREGFSDLAGILKKGFQDARKRDDAVFNFFITPDGVTGTKNGKTIVTHSLPQGGLG